MGMKGGNHMADEYIRREDALEAFTFQTAYTAHEIERTIKRLPAADTAPVVRCKDCRFYEAKQSKLCDMHHTAMLEDDYCSYGARKEPTNEPRA